MINRLLVAGLIAGLWLVESTFAQTPDSLLIESLRVELEMMHKSDQEGRKKMQSAREQHGSDSEEMKALWEEQLKVDKANISRLKEIIEEVGWPGIKMVGEDAARGAFLVLQHAELAYQEKYLPLIEEAWKTGNLTGEQLALLVDRIRVRKGEKQLYGSQLMTNPDTGKLELHPIEDEANVDKRRAEMGMISLKEYLEFFDL